MPSASGLIIIPAFREETRIGPMLSRVHESLPAWDVLVVDDGSDDRTAARARAGRARVMSLPFNLGYGGALQTGFRYAVQRGYGFVATMDADGQHLPEYLPRLVDVMEREAADVVIGSRFLGVSSYRMSFPRRLGSRIFSMIARVFTGARFTDPTSGFQLLTRPVFSFLAKGDHYPLDYPDVNILMALHKKKFRVSECPVAMIESEGKSMHGGLRPVFYVARMALAILMVLLRR